MTDKGTADNTGRSAGDMTGRGDRAAAPASKRFSRLGAALLGLGGLTVAGFTRLTWMTAQYYDDRAGGGVADVSGSDWSTEASAVSLLLIVAAIAALVLRRLGRRVVGGVAALAALAAAYTPVKLLVSGPDYGRVHTLLTAGYEDMQARSDAVASWAQVTDVSVHQLNPALAALGCVLAAVGGVLVALRPGEDTAKQNKYETEAVRREKIEDDLATSPDSGRVMWDALDAELDPTDTSGGAPEGRR
ncbi:TIGR02234 family membrane protein [Corynebacterium sp. UBA2622]|uniref:TIGR02234 family membrane protein n=1 Tax=Corynebacterium sp. UBA2622 TaxID=1946393 RepID=UPI0025BFF670|nr:TIGR02234 family membrane protein [Corynebacterium sp. UBA2622]